VLLMNGEGEDGMVAGENEGGAVALVDIGIYNDDFARGAIGLKAANCYGDIMNGAESFAMVREGVVETAGEIRGESIGESAAAGENRTAGGEPDSIDHFARPGNFQVH